MISPTPLWHHPDPLVHTVGLLALAAVIALVAYQLLRRLLRHLAAKEPNSWPGRLHEIRGPFKLVLPLSAIHIVAPGLQLPSPYQDPWLRLLNLALIYSVTWLSIRLIIMGEALLLQKHPLSEKNNLAARRVHTQVNIMRKILILLLVILGCGVGLMSFEKVRQLGTTLLASAGVAGIILGIAAQKSIATLVAGIQMAITQPIRIDDVVIVEGEWGRIEEITLTYVVVQIWDKRRMVLPVTHFLEKPFQNWTRVSSEIIGSVMLHLDYSVPLEALRDALSRVLENEALWDGETAVLQVVNSGPHTMEVRILVSAADASQAWDLRCLVRESLITFVQQNYPESLPRFRIEPQTLESAR
ncbi:mechanosensitive ion channel family protein [Acanthopleuribacter pedis]|uniref:Mechanosensitive ion channel n=1 Tax=Acanthopleuribacter pedis TaxID=442870 RepID=A0A8J7QC16_9BACT|nr:mechanosensitive ion channel domain-containing protein [Acanthopleuribacter pedis]MBO1320944.1 mechanosensitive ion channel [Acanthopleuribacter pedis]